jgi:hypothetical protein
MTAEHTALVCVDTRTGLIRRYVREAGAGMNNVRVTHHVQIPNWQEFRAGRLGLEPAGLAEFRVDPEAFYK